MSEKVKTLFGYIFYRVPPEYKNDFKLDSIERDINRFSVLPFFNILTQIACIFIYLYVYPNVYPERKQVDAFSFLLYTAIYCLINLVAIFVFFYLRRHKQFGKREIISKIAVYGYIFCYVILESSQVAVELEISGNIYRFLATFFVVAFFPQIGRLARLGYMAFYIVISEFVLIYLQRIGVNVYSYPEINIIVFVICLIAANVYYNSTIRNFVLREKLEYLTSKDELTGLANKRALNEYIVQCWQTAMRSGGTVGVLMIDIDNFKKYNDTYGHLAGDRCLTDVAKCIESCFKRAIDMTARYGGEEFVVVLSHTSLKDGLMLAEKTRKKVEELNITHPKNVPYEVITISIGAAFWNPRPGEVHEMLIRLADDALYTAKNNGRNRIEVADTNVT